MLVAKDMAEGVGTTDVADEMNMSKPLVYLLQRVAHITKHF